MSTKLQPVNDNEIFLNFSTYEMIDLMDLISSRRSFHRILPLDLIDLYLKNEQNKSTRRRFFVRVL